MNAATAVEGKGTAVLKGLVGNTATAVISGPTVVTPPFIHRSIYPMMLSPHDAKVDGIVAAEGHLMGGVPHTYVVAFKSPISPIPMYTRNMYLYTAL